MERKLMIPGDFNEEGGKAFAGCFGLTREKKRAVLCDTAIRDIQP